MLRENYSDYNRVKTAFKAFIHALVWESLDIGGEENEINARIDQYCATMQGSVIADINRHVNKYLSKSYTITLVTTHPIKGDMVSEFSSEDLRFVLEKGAAFFKKIKHGRVLIKDNSKGKIITDLRC